MTRSGSNVDRFYSILSPNNQSERVLLLSVASPQIGDGGPSVLSQLPLSVLGTDFNDKLFASGSWDGGIAER